MRDNLTERTDTRFTKPMKKSLDREADKMKMNFSELVRMILSQWLAGRKKATQKEAL